MDNLSDKDAENSTIVNMCETKGSSRPEHKVAIEFMTVKCLNEGEKKTNKRVITCIKVKKKKSSDSNKSVETKATKDCEEIEVTNLKSADIEGSNSETFVVDVVNKPRNRYRTREEIAEFGVEFVGNDDGFSSVETFNKDFRKQPDNRYECLVCYKILKENSLKQHSATHMGGKPFRCSYCNRHYTRKADAIRHVQLQHTRSAATRGPKNHCNICAKPYSNPVLLVKHLEKHKTNPSIHRCHICGVKFKIKTYYANHMSFIHSINVSSLANSTSYRAQKQIEKVTSSEKSDDDPLYDDHLDLALSESDRDSPEPRPESDDELVVIKEECNFVNDPPLDIESEDDQDAFGCSFDVRQGNVVVTQKLIKTEVLEEERDLVNKVIEATASQSQSTLALLQSSIGYNFCSAPIKEYFKAVNPDETKEDSSTSFPQTPEIHITAIIQGQTRKFIIKIPSSFIIDPLTAVGRNALMKIVNHFCSGRGKIDGLIGVTIHNPANKD